jgi:hypothetical protein
VKYDGEPGVRHRNIRSRERVFSGPVRDIASERCVGSSGTPSRASKSRRPIGIRELPLG